MSNASSPKQEVYQNLARIGTALSSAVRLELLELLAQGERSVDELATLTGACVANTSQHLQKLKAGRADRRAQGGPVREVPAGRRRGGRAVRRAGQGRPGLPRRRRPHVRLYFTAKDDLEPVPRAELLERAKKGLVTVLDVRPSEEFAAGHVPGAVNIPIHELEKRLAELPKRKEVVAYCRGPYCLMSYDAVAAAAQERSQGAAAARTACPSGGSPDCRLKSDASACAGSARYLGTAAADLSRWPRARASDRKVLADATAPANRGDRSRYSTRADRPTRHRVGNAHDVAWRNDGEPL